MNLAPGSRSRPRIHPRCRGILLLDAIMGLSVVALVAVVLAAAVGQTKRASDKLAQQRAAMRIAEQVLTQLQTGQEPTVANDGVRWGAQILEVQQAVAEHQWVRVSIEWQGQAASLVGLVPGKAVTSLPAVERALPKEGAP